jgi:hypothetical protein
VLWAASAAASAWLLLFLVAPSPVEMGLTAQRERFRQRLVLALNDFEATSGKPSEGRDHSIKRVSEQKRAAKQFVVRDLAKC